MPRLLPGALLSALMLIFASPACAWGALGHRTIGAIADRLLSPQAHAAVAALLRDDLDSLNGRDDGVTLEAVSTWADDIRGTPRARPAWHYDNIPVCGRARRADYCPDGRCNTVQLERLIAVVSNPRTPLHERGVALKWIAHLVGDIHQPLHAADNDDRGGNDVAVILNGVRTRRRTDLHGVWDNDLVRLALHTRNTRRPPPNIDALAAQAERLVRSRGQGNPESWTQDSHRLAIAVAYRYPGFACHVRPAGVVVLDSDYQRAAESVVHDQLLLAGARLAGLLNQIFAAE